jgi:diadenosine tetraphosphatase ApaH/serine/threonine PP2A family protein phosphatase
VHGSPRDPVWEYIVSASVAADNLAAFETRLCLFGHTHLPIVFRASAGEVETVRATPDEPITLNGERCLINPGSVGQPRDGNPAASYLLLDPESGSLEFRRVAYQVEVTQRLIRDADLPPRLAERLAYGR